MSVTDFSALNATDMLYLYNGLLALYYAMPDDNFQKITLEGVRLKYRSIMQRVMSKSEFEALTELEKMYLEKMRDNVAEFQKIKEANNILLKK